MPKRYIFYTIAISTILSLYLANFYLHLTDPRRNLPVNGFYKNMAITWGHVVQNNSHGFREREFAIPKPPKTYRIMVVGDSITWGPGLSLEERYTAVLERLLKKSNPEKNWEVLNFGMNGFNTLNERDTIQSLINPVNPDRIIVGFCDNDPQPEGADYTREKEMFIKKYGRYLDYAYYAFDSLGLGLLGARLEQAFYRILEKFGVLPDWTRGMSRVYNPDSKEWKNFVNALSDIKKMSNDRKLAPPIFAAFITNLQTKSPANYANPNKLEKMVLGWINQAANTARSIGFEVVEYKDDYIENFSNTITAVNKADAHPSAELNRLYAENLHKKIVGRR